MCPPAIPAFAAIAAGASAASAAAAIAGARKQAKANRKAQRAQEEEQRRQLDEQRREFKQRQAGPPAPAGFLQAASSSPWLGSMFLTGPGGAPMGATLGRVRALGGG